TESTWGARADVSVRAPHGIPPCNLCVSAPRWRQLPLHAPPRSPGRALRLGFALEPREVGGDEGVERLLDGGELARDDLQLLLLGLRRHAERLAEAGGAVHAAQQRARHRLRVAARRVVSAE